MRLLVALSMAAALLAPSACGKTPDLAAERAAIRSVDAEMVAAANARDIERWLSFVVPDAKMMPPGAPPVEGKDAIRKLVSEMMRAPEFVVAHHVRSVEVSRGGDLAYILYSYELTTQGPSRQTVTGKGKDLSIYRKESDGSWKLVIDIWSENQPPPGRS